ncbi:MAG: PadR family transcriptional regulator [Burkholderiaceae bacterium]|nr:PadR family transcriptional regulator [Microbacteriaceae bacterium]
MSSIRLFILGSLEAHGSMHGHQLRLLAEEEHIDLWTDFTVGAVYGAIKRLATEGLISGVRVEREGNRPERQVFRITAEGAVALAQIREQALRETVVRADPFDLALARLDPLRLDSLAEAVTGRIESLKFALADSEHHAALADQYLTIAERIVMRHTAARLAAEITWHEQLLVAVPEIVADETSRKEAS